MSSPHSQQNWIPDLGIFNDIVSLLQQADSPDSHVQRRLAEAVVRLEALVDAPCYFCFLLVDGSKEKDDVRQRAGLLLKSRISDLVTKIAQRPGLDGTLSSTISANELSALDYVKTNVVRAICDPIRVVRETAGTVLATIIGCQGVQQFPQVLPILFQLLDHPDAEIVDSAFGALSKIIEDELERNDICSSTDNLPIFPEFCIRTLLPKLIQLATPQTPLAQRRQSLICLNHFERVNLFATEEVFSQFFDSYWSCLGVLALDPSSEIRLPVLQGMIHIVLKTPDVLVDKLLKLIPFILDSISISQPYDVRFECLELLSHLLNQRASHVLMEEALPQ